MRAGLLCPCTCTATVPSCLQQFGETNLAIYDANEDNRDGLTRMLPAYQGQRVEQGVLKGSTVWVADLQSFQCKACNAFETSRENSRVVLDIQLC